MKFSELKKGDLVEFVFAYDKDFQWLENALADYDTDVDAYIKFCKPENGILVGMYDGLKNDRHPVFMFVHNNEPCFIASYINSNDDVYVCHPSIGFIRKLLDTNG